MCVRCKVSNPQITLVTLNTLIQFKLHKLCKDPRTDTSTALCRDAYANLRRVHKKDFAYNYYYWL